MISKLRMAHMDMTDSTKRSRSKVKKYGLVLAVILLVTFCSEAYAHFYLQISNISVVNSQDALSVPFMINGTSTFSYGGTKWLLLIQLPIYSDHPNTGRATLYIFKTEETKSFFIQGLNLIAEDVTIKSSPSGALIIQPLLLYPSSQNYSVAGLTYQILGPGAYNLDFMLTFKIYETTLLGIFPVDESTVNFNQTFTVPI